MEDGQNLRRKTTNETLALQSENGFLSFLCLFAAMIIFQQPVEILAR
jgi:hypothetical protein